MEKQRFQRIAIAAAVLLTGVLLAHQLRQAWSTESLATPAELLQRANAASESDEQRTARRQAARTLLRHGADAVFELRSLARECDDTVVRATALQGLGKTDDWESVPLLLDALEDPDVQVRGQAGGALKKIFGVDYGFQAEAPPDERARIAHDMRSRFEEIKQSYEERRASQ